jgi:hypothetical protein
MRVLTNVWRTPFRARSLRLVGSRVRVLPADPLDVVGAGPVGANLGANESARSVLSGAVRGSCRSAVGRVTAPWQANDDLAHEGTEMAKTRRTTFGKLQRERARQAKQAVKRERRQARRSGEEPLPHPASPDFPAITESDTTGSDST